jgi:hypothetical protein
MATRKGRETRAGSAANGVPTRDLDTDGMTWTRGASTNSTRVQTNRDHHLDRTSVGLKTMLHATNVGRGAVRLQSISFKMRPAEEHDGASFGGRTFCHH